MECPLHQPAINKNIKTHVNFTKNLKFQKLKSGLGVDLNTNIKKNIHMLKDQNTKYNLIYICYDYTKKLKLYKLTNKYKKIILNKFPNVKFVKFNSKNKILLKNVRFIGEIYLIQRN